MKQSLNTKSKLIKASVKKSLIEFEFYLRDTFKITIEECEENLRKLISINQKYEI